MLIRNLIYNLLEYPAIYNTLQRLASVGRMKAIRFFENKIRQEAFGRVCDIGCGTGRYSHLIKNNYYGIDMNRNYLISTKEEGKYFICGDVTKLPFKHNSFDFIYSIGFFHHITENQTREALNEVYRTIRNNGRIVIVEIFYPENSFNIFGYFLCRFDRGRYVRERQSFEEILYERFQIVESDYIKRSFPQNMRYYILKCNGDKVFQA